MKREEIRIGSYGLWIERRADGDSESPKIVGHAAVFNELSENLGGFREIIATGAFDDADMKDVRALFNHDANWILGRTMAETLALKVDKRGLAFEIDPPDTQMGRDVVTSIERGDVTGASFGFIIEEDKWNEDDDGRIVRTIMAFRQIFDVSPVAFPAYPDTDTALRELRDYREAHKRGDLPTLAQMKVKTRRALGPYYGKD